MANYEKFTEQEIPFGILERFGLTQEMVEDLPQSIMQKLLSSRWTPVLPIITEDDNEEKHKAYARIKLVRKTDGTVDVCFAPYCGFDKLGSYSDDEQDRLRDGQVIIADVMAKDGTTQKSYVQFDKETNQTMYVPVLVIQQNISIMADRMGFDYTDRDKLQNCEVLEITGKNDVASVGIDLYDPAGLRVADGDRNLWLSEAQQSEILPKYNIGIYGCWLADETGTMSYVLEEDYTEDILQEINRKGLQNATNAHMRR